MLDRYWFGEAGRISPEAPVPVVNIHQIEERPGGAGNVALNIAALGAKATLIGLSGEDSAANTLENQLTKAGVQHAIQRLPDLPTITKLRVISRHQQLIRMDFEKTFQNFKTSDLIDAFTKALTTSKLVILSDYNKGTLSCSQKLIALAKASNVPVLVDPKGQDFSIYRGANLITPNFKEFEKVVGDCPTPPILAEKARALLKALDIDALLLTRGEAGMTLIQKNKDEIIHLPAHAREVFDVTGAGDTVIAVLGTLLAADHPLPDAMGVANLAASLVVGKLGAGTVSQAELKAALHQHRAFQKGVVSEEQLIQAMAEARLQGERVVFTNGCFDIIHAGHVTYLQQAKHLGDRLVVAINDDESVRRLKGHTRPIHTVAERMAVLASLGVVDWVISYADDTPKRLLHKLKPDVLVKGGDYGIDGVVGADIVRAYGGDVRVLGCVPGLSTTSIIDRVKRQPLSDA